MRNKKPPGQAPPPATMPGPVSHQIIIGIDFGTTYSGCSWLHTGNPEARHIITTWPDGLSSGREGTSSGKVPSEIQYKDGSFKWGFEIDASEYRHSWFKLDLDPSQTRHSFGLAQNLPTSRVLPPGYDLTADQMVRDFLKALRTHVDTHLKLVLPASALKGTKKSYCLTVPAVWSDLAMHKTRAAAIAAGLSNVIMVTEPEAAAMFTLDALQPHNLTVGSSFVLCDAGGGTVDLASYKITRVEPVLELKEISSGNGGLCGSVFVNRLFETLIVNKFGTDPDWDKELLTEAMDWFELVKRKFQGNRDAKWSLPIGLADNPALGIRRGRVDITGAEVLTCFQPVIDEVIGLIKTQILGMRPNVPDSVLLVGGFGQSSYLRECVRDALHGTATNVLQPPNGWTAVVEGALMKAFSFIDPAAVGSVRVTERVARKNYGTEVQIRFDDQEHDQGKMYWSRREGCYMVGVMSWFVKKGDEVKEAEPKKASYSFSPAVAHGHPGSVALSIDRCDDVDSSGPPMYPCLSVVSLCELIADLSMIPVTQFPQKLGQDGERYFSISIEIGMTFFSGHSRYELYYEGIKRGLVKAEYV